MKPQLRLIQGNGGARIDTHSMPNVRAIPRRIKTKPTAAQKLRDFMALYDSYRAGGHSRAHAARIAYEIAICGLPF